MRDKEHLLRIRFQRRKIPFLLFDHHQVAAYDRVQDTLFLCPPLFERVRTTYSTLQKNYLTQLFGSVVAHRLFIFSFVYIRLRFFAK